MSDPHSQPNSNFLTLNLTPEKIKEILSHINDVANDLVDKGEVIMLVRHDKSQPNQFEVVAESIYDHQVEGKKLQFVNPNDFTTIFPQYNTPPTGTGNTPPNTTQNPETGQPEGNTPRVIQPLRVFSFPPADNEEYKPENVYDGDPSTMWALNKMNAQHVTDIGAIQCVGSIGIAWGLGNTRQYKFSIAVSRDGQNFDILDNLKSVYSSGRKSDFEFYNFPEGADKDGNNLCTCKYIMVQVEGNTSEKVNERLLAAISNITILKDKQVKSEEVKTPIEETPTTVENPPTTTTPQNPPTTDPQTPAVPPNEGQRRHITVKVNQATSNDEGNAAENLLDGVNGTRWSSKGPGAFVIFETNNMDADTGKSKFNLIGISWFKGTNNQEENKRKYRFNLAISNDKKTWTEIWKGHSQKTTEVEGIVVKPVERTKYIKLTGFGSNQNKWVSINAIDFYYDESLVGKETPIETNTKPNPTDPLTPPEVGGNPPEPQNPPVTEPTTQVPTGENELSMWNGMKLIVPRKKGGQVTNEIKYKRSSHNTGVRDSFWVDGWNPSIHIQFAYVTMWLSDTDEEFTFKSEGDDHNDEKPKLGRCYCVGFEVRGTPSFKKEYPQHNNTPDFSNKVNFFDPNFKSLGDRNGKRTGIQVVKWNTPQNTVIFYVFIDTVGDGNFKPWWWVEDKGQFAGEPYLTNQGVQFGGKGEGKWYIRIDTVEKKSIIEKAGGCEIDTPSFAADGRLNNPAVSNPAPTPSTPNPTTPNPTTTIGEVSTEPIDNPTRPDIGEIQTPPPTTPTT